MPRILVADDNTNIQKMVTLAFQERGVEVIAVGNGEAAVRRMPDANPDLVLADVFMPVRNGYEVCEFVKKDTRFAHVPVILLVGAFDPLDEKEARRVGADGVLKKPFVPPDPLIAMVMSALEKNPRVAAELAKAKEVVAVVETALPAAALENPAMAEPKPLPDFPEPTPEEAAVIYGFGKGVRAMDLDEEAEEEHEPRAKKKSKEAAAPKAPAKNEKAPKISTGPKTQVAVPDDDEESPNRERTRINLTDPPRRTIGGVTRRILRSRKMWRRIRFIRMDGISNRLPFLPRKMCRRSACAWKIRKRMRQRFRLPRK